MDLFVEIDDDAVGNINYLLPEELKQVRKKKFEKKEESESESDESESDEEDQVSSSDIICNVQTDLAKLIDNEKWSDVHFAVGPERVRISAHRALLAARSPVFAALLFSQFIESQTQEEIPVPDIDPEAFRIMLRGMYADKVKLTPGTAIAALFAAKKYQVEVLRHACVKYMTKGLTADSACSLLSNVSSLLEEEKFIFDYLEDHADDVLESDGFMTLSLDNILKFVKSSALNCSEIDLFEGVIRWATSYASRGAHHVSEEMDIDHAIRISMGKEPMMADSHHDVAVVLSEVLPFIRFPLMSMDELARRVQPTNILPPNTLLELFTYVGSKEAEVSGTTVWFCQGCTLRNMPEATKCVACGGTEKKFATKPWTCARCTLRNDAFSVRCNACGGQDQIFEEDKRPFEFSCEPRRPRRPRNFFVFSPFHKGASIQVNKKGLEISTAMQLQQWESVLGEYEFLPDDKHTYEWEYELTEYDSQNSYNVSLSLDCSPFQCQLPNCKNPKQPASASYDSSFGGAKNTKRRGQPNKAGGAKYQTFNSLIGYSGQTGFSFITGTGHIVSHRNGGNPLPIANANAASAACKKGDKVGFRLNVPKRSLELFKNGRSLGVIFDDVVFPCRPVVSLIRPQRVTLNFDTSHFR